MRHAIYAHTQAVKLLWAIVLPVTVGVGVSLLAEKGVAGWPGVALLLGVNILLLMALGHFTVEVGEGCVEWRFGVLGWPRWQVALDQITGAELTTSSALEGWGIRRTRTGMLYNAHGQQAVRLHLRDGRTLRLGSDEPERLMGYIAPRLPTPATARPPAG
ncbi:MAG: hypothetical protein C0505_02920 [Leptothrix sp. (in: Bacteria)]|nr:hypothetical protein [Leptothrix sp. (in: b-proteobacteria)]